MLLHVLFDRARSDCEYKEHKVFPAADKKLASLKGHRYKVDDDKYQYLVGICTRASDDLFPNAKAAVIQLEKDNDGKVKSVQDHHPVLIGQFDHTDIKSGTDWIYLEYLEGQAYHSHCGGEPRRASILLTCDPEATDSTPGMRILEENNNKTSDCYYLFELAHPEVCANASSSKNMLSVGSIVLIVFFCVAAIYLVAGGLYQRFVLGAKGIEQIPNYEFWKDFGNLQADGCNFVCRTDDLRRSSPYKGLGDDQLVEEPDERDDNLLPM